MGLHSANVGTLAGRFRSEGLQVGERIGRGVVGEVWRAKTRAGRDVALKVIATEISSRPQFLTLFERESAALASLTHSNIVRLVDRGRNGDDFFLATEYMPGGSLRDTMQPGRRVPVADALSIAIAVCEALDYAHMRGIPHRNLRSSNIFVQDGQIKVSDFGLTALLARTAPGEPPPGDVRTDLFSLASILYEMICGDSPATGARFVPPSSRVPGVAPRLDQVLARALSDDPLTRFARASEFGLALRLAHTASKESAVPEPHPSSRPTEGSEDEPFTVTVKRNIVSVTVLPTIGGEALASFIPALERVLDKPGPWKVGYDLSALHGMEAGLDEAISRLHRRHLRNLRRVAFCSPRALVRGRALVIGGSVRLVPSKVFAASEAMDKWLSEEGA